MPIRKREGYNPVLIVRFWESVIVNPDNECWGWSGPRITKGRAKVSVGYDYALGSHLSLHLDGRRRPPAPNDKALHSCDNNECCNPKHLRWGTQLENITDRVQRGRSVDNQVRGSRRFNTALTEDVVRQIKYSDIPSGKLIEAYGINYSVISRIRTGKTWSHV